MMKKISDFLLFASGVDRKILAQCPTDESKYWGIGGTIFFTGLFAAMSSGYALFTVFDNYIVAVSLGLLWGLLIFNLDRFIVSSMRKSERPWHEFLTALPRLLLAVIISLVIAKPFELKIFSKEIEPELVIMEQKVYAQQEAEAARRFEPTLNRLRQDIQRLQQEVDAKAQQRNELLKIAQQEADGTGGSKVKNLGPIYKVKKADADRVEAELRNLSQLNRDKIATLETELTHKTRELQETTDRLERTKLNGPAARLEALHHLTQENPAIWWTDIFIMVLFLLIEISPILVKLVSGRGPYDTMLHAVEHEFRCREVESVAVATDETKKRTTTLGKNEHGYVIRKLDAELG